MRSSMLSRSRWRSSSVCQGKWPGRAALRMSILPGQDLADDNTTFEPIVGSSDGRHWYMELSGGLTASSEYGPSQAGHSRRSESARLGTRNDRRKIGRIAFPLQR